LASYYYKGAVLLRLTVKYIESAMLPVFRRNAYE